MGNKKIAFVTGANKGIGLATSRLLAQKGYQVWMGVRNLQRAQQAYRQLRQDGLDVYLVQIDISNDESVSEATTQLVN